MGAGPSVLHGQGGQAGQGGAEVADHRPALQPTAAEAGQAGEGGQLAQQGSGVSAQLAAGIELKGAELACSAQRDSPTCVDCEYSGELKGRGSHRGLSNARAR